MIKIINGIGILILCLLFSKTLYGASDSLLLGKLESADVHERMDGFYALANIPNPKGNECSFKISDSGIAKKSIFKLLVKESEYEQKNMVNGNYGPNLEDGFAGYIGDVKLVVDSCADKDAVTLFPGPITADKFPEQTFKALVSKMEENVLDGRLMSVVTGLALRYKDTDTQTYSRAKRKLIEYVSDNGGNENALRNLKKLNDLDLIPVFEKVAKYDDSKSQAASNTKINKAKRKRMSKLATEALRKLKIKYSVNQSSATSQ